MKKVLVLYIAFVIAFLGCVNIVNGVKNELTDNKLMNEYIHHEHGEDYYGEIYDSDDEFVRFVVYNDGKIVYYTSINRGYYQDLYNE